MDGLEEKLIGEIKISSGKIIILAPGDGNPGDKRKIWFRDVKDYVAKNIPPLNVAEYQDMVLFNMLTTSYSVFQARKNSELITVDLAKIGDIVKPNTIAAFDSVLACCDLHKISWDLRGDKAYTTELKKGIYQVKFIETYTLGISPKK